MFRVFCIVNKVKNIENLSIKILGIILEYVNDILIYYVYLFLIENLMINL